MDVESARILFLYWGRRGALSRFTLELGRAALVVPGLRATLSVSQQNESFGNFREFGDALFPVKTFVNSFGSLAGAWRLPQLRQRFLARIMRDRTQAVITLMPHVWTPLIAPAIRRAGVRYVTIIHDAHGHHGDPTGLLHGWMLRDVLHADLVVTLSSAVAGSLQAAGLVPARKILVLFHPDLYYGSRANPQPPHPGEAFRLLFLGRILPYKGFDLLLDALDIVKGEGVPVELGVFGEGPLDPWVKRLSAIGAEVVNRWLSEEEIGNALRRYHAVVLSHVEASQSGVAAAALGAGVPLIVTPVGGLREQILHGQTGLVASHADAPSLAAAITQLYGDPELYRAMCAHICATEEQRSMRRFVTELASHTLNSPAIANRCGGSGSS
jgi:glycosyltransferase involved in cell wall biosynthesis